MIKKKTKEPVPLSPDEIEIIKGLKRAEKTEGIKMRKIGKRTKYKSNKTLIKKCNEFFEFCEQEDKPTTLERLAVFLGISKTTLNKYENDPLFKDTIIEAKERCGMHIVDDALDKNKSTPIHSLYLKNNMGYKDKVEVENTNVTPINIILDGITGSMDSLINKENKFLINDEE